MASVEIEASGSWFHLSNAVNDSKSKWMEGTPRKGLRDGQENISLILFDGEAIRAALTDSETGDPIPLQGAELVLNRDTAYGESAVTVTIAPAKATLPPQDYVSRAESLALANRKLHHAQSVSGTTATIKIPGATLTALADGDADAIMIYHEKDETADTYVKFTGKPILRLYTGELVPPVWTRNIVKGTVISGDIYSHQADLRELLYYINLRRNADGLSPIGTLSIGPYAAWPDVISAMQDAIDDIIQAEQGEAVTWTEATAGMMPQAALIAELREALKLAGGDDVLAAATATLYATQAWGTNSTQREYDKSLAMTWVEGVSAGTQVQSTQWSTGGHSGSVGVSIAACGGWLFGSLPAGTRKAKLKVTLLSKKDSGETTRVTLLGIKVSERPAEQMSFSEVFDETVLGYADCAVGVESEIALTADAVQRLMSGNLHGIGMGPEGGTITFSETATLVADNDTTEE